MQVFIGETERERDVLWWWRECSDSVQVFIGETERERRVVVVT